MIIKGLKVLTVHQLFPFVQILPLYMQTQWFHLYVVLFGMKKDQLQFKKNQTSLNRSFFMYYIKYGQQIIMNLIIIESIQTKNLSKIWRILFSLLYIYLSNISNGHEMNTAWYVFTLDYHDEIYASQVSIPLSSPPDLANVCMMHLEI